MSPEEAQALLSRITLLQRFGEKLADESRRGKITSDDDITNYRSDAWLSEVEALVVENFDQNSALAGRAKEFRSSEDGRKVPLPAVIPMALDLLGTVKEFVFIDPQSAASEPLRNLIEQTLKERYFKSPEMRLLAAAFAFVTACFFGGTIYLGLQVQGVTTTAEAARKSIESNRDSVVTLGNEAVQRVGAKANEQASAQIAKLNAAIESSTKSINDLSAQLSTDRDALDRDFRNGQTSIKKLIEDAVNQIPASVNAQLVSKQPMIDAAIAKLNTSIETSTKAINDLATQLKDDRIALDKEFKDGQTTIKKASDDAAGQFPANVNTYLASKQPSMDAAIDKELNEKIQGASSRIQSKVDDASAQIQDKVNFVNMRAKNFEDALPATTTYLNNRVSEFNAIVNHYSEPIDEILARFAGHEQLSAIQSVSLVLGSAARLIGVVVVFAVLALVAAGGAIFHARKSRVARIARIALADDPH
jgi:hypothetical protein